MSISVRDLLTKISPDTEKQVDQIRKRIGPVLREALRKETGLMLNRREVSSSDTPVAQESISVPIHLVTGVPTVLKSVSFEDHHWLVSALSRWRGTLVTLRDSSTKIRILLDELRNDTRGLAVLNRREEHLPPITDLVNELLQALDSADPVRRILEVNEDVLGCYRSRLPSEGQYRLQVADDPFDGRIELYWGIIGLIAGLLGVSIESLTTVVLAHELAHAYTHLGTDIDGQRWGSRAFTESQHELKEGLAQYYTHLTCLKLKSQIPDVFNTYEQLLRHQPEAYTTHIPWVECFKPEEVRLAMIEIRRRNSGQSDLFGQLTLFTNSLKAARQRLRS